MPSRFVGPLLVSLLVACSAEQRPIATKQPVTPPQAGVEDVRIALYQDNHYQVSQGGRYFVWYGCGNCHVDGAPPALDLSDRRHVKAFAEVYAHIAHGHAGSPRYEDKVPVEPLWQLAAYVRSLPDQRPGMPRRQGVDLTGEPKGSAWSGPLR